MCVCVGAYVLEDMEMNGGDNIKADYWDIIWEIVHCLQVLQEVDQKRAVVKAVMNIWLRKGWEFLTTWNNIISSIINYNMKLVDALSLSTLEINIRIYQQMRNFLFSIDQPRKVAHNAEVASYTGTYVGRFYFTYARTSVTTATDSWYFIG